MSRFMSAGELVVKRAVGATACVWVVGATGCVRRGAGPQQQQPSWCGAYTDLHVITTARTMALHTWCSNIYRQSCEQLATADVLLTACCPQPPAGGIPSSWLESACSTDSKTNTSVSSNNLAAVQQDRGGPYATQAVCSLPASTCNIDGIALDAPSPSDPLVQVGLALLGGQRSPTFSRCSP